MRRPDVSPDGTRLVYSSYLGRQWQQLWLLPVDGGYPFPLTYGDYDNTNPRWSPDGRTIAFISNRSGNTALWLIDAFSGEQRPLQIAERRYLKPHRELDLRVVDEAGNEIASADQHHRQPAAARMRRTTRGCMPTTCSSRSGRRSRRGISTAPVAAGSRFRSIGSRSPSATVRRTRSRTLEEDRAHRPAGRAREP